MLYYGFSPRDGDGPHEHHWTIKTSGVSVDDGGDPNPQGKNRNVGLVDLDEQLPFDFSARVTVKGDMTSQNLEACIGEGHVEFIGGGLLSPIGVATLAVFAAGSWACCSTPGLPRRGRNDMEGVTMAKSVIVRHPIRGLLWGLLLGIGLAFVLVFSTLMEFAVLPITVTIVIGLVFGVLWGLLGPARSPKSPPPEPVPVTAGTPAPSRFDDSTESSAPHAEQAADPGEAKPPEPAD